ncbi:TetR/AcrR family transcriptional regulator [Nonomuraea sp. SYSU D8015]|uniref:TetR/AcrR family transcriptional regulator n=1 Tax=Nonomuraea sp. SYSU D8015 TaxID=2593644 RepID=UPI0016618897|nr:TetR/AcrR family transcriptional regulator [Nonomuraea sp. SYSU D8015]
MTTEYAGSGDSERTLELLWGGKEPAGRGPRPKLTVRQIADAAIEVADSEGLEVLSMRRVAERLGVGTMSLYTYVPGKHELIDVMLDTVIGEVPLVDDDHGDWRAKLTAIARNDWALYTRHPWVLQIAGHRPVMGPNTLAAVASSLRAVTGIGLSEAEMVSVIDFIDAYVRGKAREAVDIAQAERRTQISDDQWWQRQIPLWERHIDLERYPMLTNPAIAEAIVGAGADLFEFGLQRALDGIQAYLDARTRSQPHDPPGRTAP